MGSALIPHFLERRYSEDVVDPFWFGNALPVDAGIFDKDHFEVTGVNLSSVAASDIAAFPYRDTPTYRAKCSARIVDDMSMGKAVIITTIVKNIK